MERELRRVWLACAFLAGFGLAACDGGGQPSGQPGAPSAPTNSDVQRWRESLRQALERLDTSTAEGRRELHAALRREWEEHRAQLDTLAHEMHAATREQREAALAKARELTEQLERRLDDLEDAGSEQWNDVKLGAVEHAERVRLELERLLADKNAAAIDQR